MVRARKHDGVESFEDSLQRLESIVERLERGNVPLEESLRMYEEGMVLSRKCLEKLSQAEKKLKVLSRNLPDQLGSENEQEN